MSELHGLSITTAAAGLESGEWNSRELCETVLRRVREVDAKIGAYVGIEPDAILAAADAADKRRREGRSRGRFEGVPLAVKDNIAVNGQRLGCASKILDGFTAPYDATVIKKLRDAGFLFCGRTNMDEFAMGSSTENSGIQVTSNPYALDRVPGGSSGGSAAAVSSSQALAALGSDTGGSIRLPASFCGIVGLKPSYGRVSRYGLVAYASSLDQIGALTHTVRDSAAILDIIAGLDPLDSTSLNVPSGGHEDALHNAQVDGLRVGLPREYFEVAGLDAEVREAILSSAHSLEQQGAEIVDVSLPMLDYAIAAYYIIATAEASTNLARFDGIRYGFRDAEGEKQGLLDLYRQSRAKGFGKEVKRRIILGTYVLSSGYYDAYYLRAQKVRTLIRRDFERVFNDCDIIFSPVAPQTAYAKGELASPLQMYLTDIYTISANLAGICGISLPCGMSRGGLPIGLQMMAPALEEKRLLRTAHAFESIKGPITPPSL